MALVVVIFESGDDTPSRPDKGREFGLGHALLLPQGVEPRSDIRTETGPGKRGIGIGSPVVVA